MHAFICREGGKHRGTSVSLRSQGPTGRTTFKLSQPHTDLTDSHKVPRVFARTGSTSHHS
eukprot:3554026-Prorocentrum_lima.AAC.1